MRIISVPAKNSAFAALESIIDARMSLDGKGQVPFVLLLCYVFHRLIVIDCHRLSSIVIDYRFNRLVRPGDKLVVSIGK